MERDRRSVFLAAFLLLLTPLVAIAQWQDGVPLSTEVSNQDSQHIIPDGAGGVIVAWEDSRFGTRDIYAQRINANGVATWAINGVAVCTAAGAQQYVRLVSDGAGGAIFAWQDSRGASNDIYAQHVTAAGALTWSLNGIPVCTATGSQAYPQVVEDGIGGAIVLWSDNRAAVQLYAQRVTSIGGLFWALDGVPITAAPASPNFLWTLDRFITAVSDGVGGAIVTWEDGRAGIALNDIYAQRVNPAGAAVWAAAGVAVCTAAGLQSLPRAVSDGAGGAIVVWKDPRGASQDIYAQRIVDVGGAAWLANGVAVCTAVGTQDFPAIATDGASGAIMTWQDARGGSIDVYARRVLTNGTLQWAADGNAISLAAGNQTSPELVSDGSGGATITWPDTRNGNSDIFVQRVNSAGTVQGTVNGDVVCNQVANQLLPVIATGYAGSAIIAWEDERTDTGDIFAQRTGQAGTFAIPAPTIVGVRDIPGDQGGKVNVYWTASSLDVPSNRLVDHYSVWRAINPTTAASALASGEATLLTNADIAFGKYDGALRSQRINDVVYYWKMVSTIDASALAGYSDVVPTLFDSTATSNEVHYFQVMAHWGGAFWASAPATGRSVDNIAPPPPVQFTVERLATALAASSHTSLSARTLGDVRLRWRKSKESDIDDYVIYRSTANDVQPTPTFFLDSTADTVYIDSNAPLGQSFYYVLTARDVHGNASTATGTASVGPSTGSTPTPPLRNLSLRPNYPNPFSGSTALDVGLPSRSNVTVEIFDVAGRRVQTIAMRDATAGWTRMTIGDRDEAGSPLPSGVYLLKVSAQGESVTRKIVIMR
jgi:FlgD Ig-like domain